MNGEDDGILALVKETVDGLGRLIADHAKLARLELVADVKAQGRRVATVALCLPFVFLGYALACVGLALALAPLLGGAGAFFAVGGVHFFAGALAVAVAIAKLKDAGLMRETTNEVTRSLATLSQPAVADAPVVPVREVAKPRSAPVGTRGA